MATPTWKYPDTSAPTSTLEFPRGGFLSDGRSPIGNVVTDESESGEPMQASLGSDKYEHTFTVQVPTTTQAGNTADVTKLHTFIQTTVGWMARTFYYTDSNSNSYAVKLMNTDLEPTRRLATHNQYVFRLREV